MSTTELIAGYTQYTTAEEFADAAHDNSAPATTPTISIVASVTVASATAASYVSVSKTIDSGC
ncbi:LxmA leader domain family RiPP [Streptomyces sp. NPDC006649]|uniref:LxmA leader domain family RiPP n=1 Tax=Streptomyces sp. NPDC006649 TaxID=3156896 RepID=UPI0033BD8A17